MMQSVLLQVLLSTVSPSTIDRLNEPAWVEVKPRRVSDCPRAGRVLADIDQRLDALGVERMRKHVEDPATYGHESAHMVSAAVRNGMRGRVNAFYVGEGKACVLKEPRATIARAAQFVPAVLRGDRFKTYLGNPDSSWNSEPLYILDEWNGYMWEAAVALSQTREKKPLLPDRREAVGQIEFIPYVLGLYLAVEADDPDYLASDDGAKFRRFLAWGIRRSMNQYNACQAIESLRWRYDLDLAHADAKALKAVYDKLLNERSATPAP
jgi:hypothetical protein